MARAAIVLLNERAVALIQRRREDDLYFLFPGGQVEPGEDLAATAAREAREELGLEIEVDGIVAEVTFNGRAQTFFRAQQVGGVFGTGTGEELLRTAADPSGTYRPVWVSVDDLSSLDVRPRELADVVARIPVDGWPAKPLRLIEARGQVTGDGTG